MTDQLRTIHEDLAFMRAVATGARGRLAGGAILATGGFAFGAASLGQWAMLTGRAPSSSAAVIGVWGVASLVYYAVLWSELRRLRRDRTGYGQAAQAAGQTWFATGLAFFTIIVGFFIANWRTGSPFVWTGLPVVAFSLYGAGWTVAGHASGRFWLKAVGVASFAAAVAVALVSASPDVWLAYALGLVALLGAPGLALMRQGATD